MSNYLGYKEKNQKFCKIFEKQNNQSEVFKFDLSQLQKTYVFPEK